MSTILFLGANPSSTTSLALQREVREIQRRLGKTSFTLDQAWAVRVEDLQGALLRYDPEIVHFSGHGERGRAGAFPREASATRGSGAYRPPAAQREPAGILVEADDGSAVRLDVRAVGDLFRILRGRIRVVVLNACYSAEQAEAIRPHVDYVIGMSRAIHDEAAVAFAATLYDALGAGEPVPAAFQRAKDALRASGIGDEDVPVLLARS